MSFQISTYYVLNHKQNDYIFSWKIQISQKRLEKQYHKRETNHLQKHHQERTLS